MLQLRLLQHHAFLRTQLHHESEKRMKTYLCTALLACAATPFTALFAPLLAAPAQTTSATTAQSPDEIMAKVDHAARKAYNTQLASVKITTCKYTLANGGVKCSEKPRVVVAE